MFNLIKMDFYRLFRSKAFRVGIIAAVITALIGVLVNYGILEIIKLGMQDGAEGVEELSMFFPILQWLSVDGVDFASVVMTGTGFLALFIGCMISASFVGAEQSCGYVKNIAGQLPNKGLTVVSKFVVTCFIQLVVLLVYVIVCSITANMFFGGYIVSYSIGKLLALLGLRFLLFCAIDAILLFFCTLTKSHAIAMVIGAIFGIGVTYLLYWAVNMLLSVVNITVKIAEFMPDGINSLINISNLGTITGRAILVAVVFIAGFLGGAVLLFKKRDVK